MWLPFCVLEEEKTTWQTYVLKNWPRCWSSYSVAVQPGDKVLIRGGTLAAPLLKAVYAKVLQAGGHPLMMASLDGQEELFYRYASDEQLKYIPEPLKVALETYDVNISIRADANTKALSGIDPAKMVLQRRAGTELMKIFMRRSASGELRWTSTLYPTQAYAQDAEMSLSEYEDFVYGACMPDLDDPVGHWQRFSAWQQKIVDWLKGKERVHVVGPETDLTAQHRRAHLYQQRRQAQHAQRRGLYRPGRGQRRGTRALFLSRHHPGPRGNRHSAVV